MRTASDYLIRCAGLFSDDVWQRPLQLTAQTAGLNERPVRPVADRETLVAARALLVSQTHFATLLRLCRGLWRGHRRLLIRPAGALSASALYWFRGGRLTWSVYQRTAMTSRGFGRGPSGRLAGGT